VQEVYRSLEAWQGLENGTPVSGAVMHAVQTGATEHDGDIRVFVDASVYSNVNHAYFGFVILISIGNYWAARNGPLRCMNDVHLAEALAVKEALLWVKDQGYTFVRL